MTDRYESMHQPEDVDATQGLTINRWDAEVRKQKVNKIDMETYEINAPAVAEAILARLLAGANVLPKSLRTD